MPHLDAIAEHIDGQVPALPDGSSELPMDWRGMWAGGLGLLLPAPAQQR